MKKKISFIAVSLLLLSFYVPAYAAGVPLILGYQGRLTDSSGNLLGTVSGTTYYFKFSIWDGSTVGAGNKLWPITDPASVSAAVRQGVFNVNIGDTANGYPDSLNYNFSNNNNIYLQVEVSSTLNGTYETLSPRQRISAAPFAQVSGAVSGTGQSSFGTTTPFDISMVSIEATSTRAVGLSIRAMASQLANLFQIQDYLGTNLFLVDNNGKVAVGTSTATRKFNVLNTDSAPQLRLSQTGSVYGEFYVDSAGDVQLSSTGGNIRNQNENLWVCAGGSCGADTPADQGNIIVETSVTFDNNFKFKLKTNAGATTTTIMLDSLGNEILEFDEDR